MNTENILKVAQAIEDAAKPDARPEIGFNMRFYVQRGRKDQTGHRCGTVCCVAGWSRFIETGSDANGWRSTDFDAAADFLGISRDEAMDLFVPDDREVGPLSRVRPAHAVAVLRHLAVTGEVDWTVGAPASG